jgi:hypothetical protein
MSFSRPKFTNAGRNLQLRSIGGTEICFTRIKVGAGELVDGQDFRTFTDLIDPKVNLTLTGISIDDGYAKIKGYFTNEGQTEAFNYREVGLFAKDPDDESKEILYCYANYGKDYAYIADPSSEIIERTVTIVAIVDDAVNVTAVLDSSAVYVDHDELDSAIDAHNRDPYAHPDLIGVSNLTAEAYVNPETMDSDNERDGSKQHPFKYVKEALDAFPPKMVALLTIRIVESEASTAYDSQNYYAARIEGYPHIAITTEEGAARAKLNFIPAFFECESVTLDNLSLALDSNPTYSAETGYGPAVVLFEKVGRVRIGDVTDGNQTHTPNAWAKFSGCGMVDLNKTTFTGLATNGIKAEDTELIKIGRTTTITSSQAVGFDLSNSCLICLAANSAVTPARLTTTSLYIDKATAEKLSDGTFSSHIDNKSNPHNVTLAQAMSAGGTVNVAHGGTGKTTLTAGALLKGNGSSSVSLLSGIGALFATASGSPQFGTLPIAQGGTGRTNDGITKATNQQVNGTPRGKVILPGSSAGKSVKILWGRSVVSWDNSAKTRGKVTATFDAAYDNSNYVAIYTASNFSSAYITKSTNKFELTVGSSLLADDESVEWITIGFIN